MCDWRKLLRRVTSRPEIEIADKRLAFSIQTPSIEPSYKTAPNQVKLSISQKVQGLCKNFRLQHVLNLVTLTVRRPQHPYLKWCSLIFLHGNFSRLVPLILIWATIRTFVCTHTYVLTDLYSCIMSTRVLVQGRSASYGYLVTRITVTLSI